MARAIGGHVLGPVTVAGQPSASIVPPTIAVRGRNAVSAWVSYQGDPAVRDQLRAMFCTEKRCARPETVSSWAPAYDLSNPLPGSPAVVWVGSRAMILFRGGSSQGPRLQWSISGSGRFGSVQTLGVDGLYPRLAAAPNGRVLAVWQALSDSPASTDIESGVD